MTASIENGKNHDMVAILDAGAQYGKVKKLHEKKGMVLQNWAK